MSRFSEDFSIKIKKKSEGTIFQQSINTGRLILGEWNQELLDSFENAHYRTP